MFLPSASCSASFVTRSEKTGIDGRTPSVEDREGRELDAVCPAQSFFLGQAQLSNFIGCEERDNDIDAGSAPGMDFVFKPVAAARAWRNGQTARPRPLYPVQLCPHGVILLKMEITIYRVRQIIRSFGMISSGRESSRCIATDAWHAIKIRVIAGEESQAITAHDYDDQGIVAQ
jgi:hypothetical protein